MAAPPPPARLPALVAFDLDATLWTPEMYELSGAPFRVDRRGGRGADAPEGGHVVDRAGERVTLMGDSRAILRELATDPRWAGTTVAYVSRTEHPKWADACLRLFTVADGVSMHALAAQHQIYPGGKRTHFRRIHEATGIAYEDMLFFDNEVWNVKEVGSGLDVVSVHCPRGMTAAVWAAGLAAFSAAAAARAAGGVPVTVLADKRAGADW